MNRIYRIGCGANGADYRWTEVVMEQAGRQMNGLSVHYYTVPTGNWSRKGSATRFGEGEWHATMREALKMEELVSRHAAAMDKFDAQKRVGMIVDEWGIWHDVEPGTNPGFLYQQNTMRDALVAGMTLNIFNNHADRVKMANIAQTINVLQAIILTDKEKMILTPTYHVFEMYSVHQDAKLLPTEVQSADYKSGNHNVPTLNVSASRNKEGAVHVTLCNLNPTVPAEVKCELNGVKAAKVSGRVLTAAEVTAHNTFDQPERVKPAPFNQVRINGEGGGFSALLPPMSVTVVEVR